MHKNALESIGIGFVGFVGFGSDGAAVNSGPNSGVSDAPKTESMAHVWFGIGTER